MPFLTMVSGAPSLRESRTTRLCRRRLTPYRVRRSVASLRFTARRVVSALVHLCIRVLEKLTLLMFPPLVIRWEILARWVALWVRNPSEWRASYIIVFISSRTFRT